LEEERGEAWDKIVYKTVGEDAGKYNIYEISSDIYRIKGEGGETEGYCRSGTKRKEH
jgi:hypothetical protein